MWEHFPPRASAGSRGPAPPYHHHHHQQQQQQHVAPPDYQQQHVAPPDCQQQHAAPHGDPDPLASAWIRRLHLAPSPPPPRASLAPPPSHDHDAVSARSAGFGPFRWSPRPPVGAPAPCGGGGAPPMMSPFFRSPPQPLPALAGVGEFPPVRPTIGFGSGFPVSPSPTVLGVNPHASWLPTAAAAYPNHDVDMVPIRTSHDLHVRQHSMIPQNFARRTPSSSSEHDKPFSYWNMGRFQRSTTTSSISQVAVEPGNFVKKRNADSNSVLPLKFRKLSGAG
ncbi:hypothetical protein CFC21_053598 [Triticum aestivum]|uniref:Uncharacterized protein n=3 Tax=Triticum TaxID=4564 RepID=A0A9R0SHW0_TRITD|nr:hypothetical protein CFC21_053598 [Triticum aestivum]VAH95612.1 unnamed protein product [Triticum turgidum subsp. durum]